MKVISAQDYLEKTGDERLLLEQNVETDNDKGFCIWTTSGDALVLSQVYGDGSHWNSWATNKAKELNMKKITFGTKLNPDMFTKYGFSVIGVIMERKV